MGGPLGDEDPKCKCKEVSRTKMQLKFVVELKWGTLGWVLGWVGVWVGMG